MRLNHRTHVLDNGQRINVITAGSGTPLVLMHGLSVRASTYTEVIEALAELGFYVIAPDAPNHGDSGSLPWGHTVTDMIEFLPHLLDRLDIVQAVIAGHSMGGAMAVEFAANYPDRTLAAILMDAAAGPEYHEGVALTPGPNIPTRALRFAVGGLVDILGDAVTAYRSRTLRERLDLLSILKGSVNGCRFIRAAKALTDADSEQQLEKMRLARVRTVVIHGEHDQIVPFEAGRSTAVATDGHLYMVTGGFHSWLLADPEFAAEKIQHALAQVVL
jgi:pimeloyl-ACP methyl ester carboxylesterase